MPMVEGQIIIDPFTGLETFIPPAGPNAAKEAYTILKAGTPIPASVLGPSLGVARESIAVAARAMAALIVHVQVNANVTSVVTVTSVGGVTTGGGVSGPGVGTSTGTIT